MGVKITLKLDDKRFAHVDDLRLPVKLDKGISREQFEAAVDSGDVARLTVLVERDPRN